MDLISDISNRNTTLANVAAELAQSRPEECAVLFDNGVELTYGEAWQQSQQLAAAMQSVGLRQGDTLSFQLPNTIESVIVAIAASICGLVINPIVPIYRGKEVSFILRDARTKIVFIPRRYRDFDFPNMILDLKAQLPDLEHVVCVGADGEIPDEFLDYQSFLMGGVAADAEKVSVDPNDTKILLYTSGTTGNPKAVRHSHNTLTKALDNGRVGWRLGPDDMMLMPSPVTHITGYVNGIELPFFTDTRVLLMEAWVVDKAVTLIEDFGATVCVSATPFLQELITTCKRLGKTLPGFRLFACGGASVPPALIYEASTTFADCLAVRVYGSTEVPLVTVGFPESENSVLAAETDGRIHNYDVRVCDDNGNDLGVNVEGELVVRGPAMMLGYADQAQNAAAFDTEGFFKTGDIGKLLPSGAILITDRKKDIIIRGGENLSAREIEEAILQHPAILEAAVVAAPHARLGEGVAAFVVTHSNDDVALDDVLELLSEMKLAKQKWPQYLSVERVLPKTASGKVQKEVLRRQLRDNGVQL